MLGAIAETTERVGIATGLTCPIIRYHPAIIAQAAATIGVMSEGRFTLALGAGERLNEHVVGYGWPPVHHRHEMLREAVEIMRRLWEGELYSHSGEYYEVESARIYDLPEEPVPIVIGISGKKSATLAGKLGAGVMAVEAEPSLIKDWKSGGGEGATKYIKPEDLEDSVPHGPDPEPYIKEVKKAVDAGFDHIVLMGVGPDQEAFIEFFERTLAPELQGLTARAGGPARNKSKKKK